MRLKNKTRYSSKDLRAAIRACTPHIKDYFNDFSGYRRALVIRVVYSRRGEFFSGRANLGCRGNHPVFPRITLCLPKNPEDLNKKMMTFAFIFIHETVHNAGLRHREMVFTKSQLWSDLTEENYGWAKSLTVGTN